MLHIYSLRAYFWTNVYCTYILLDSLSSKYFKDSGFGRFSFSIISFYKIDNEDVKQMLRERRLTFGNKDELLEMIARTRNERRQWIQAKLQDVTTIIKHYPHFLDMKATVRAKL